MSTKSWRIIGAGISCAIMMSAALPVSAQDIVEPATPDEVSLCNTIVEEELAEADAWGILAYHERRADGTRVEISREQYITDLHENCEDDQVSMRKRPHLDLGDNLLVMAPAVLDFLNVLGFRRIA